MEDGAKEAVEKKRLILLVDSDPEAMEVSKLLLEEAGYAVYCCEDGKKAIRTIERKPVTWKPFLVFVDVVIPGIGGYELVRRIADHYRERQPPIGIAE